MKKAIFPGSFDPITVGHVDIVRRGIKVFDEIIIAVGDNTDKKYMFPKEKRVEFIKQTFNNYDNINIESYDGLTVRFCKKNNIEFMIRGLRNPADFELEKSIALTNREMTGIETIFFLTSPENSFISSSIVRDLIRNNGDYKLFIPKGITF
jgi:pantetheine-phosphate adenylyltransferase